MDSFRDIYESNHPNQAACPLGCGSGTTSSLSEPVSVPGILQEKTGFSMLAHLFRCLLLSSLDPIRTWPHRGQARIGIWYLRKHLAGYRCEVQPGPCGEEPTPQKQAQQGRQNHSLHMTENLVQRSHRGQQCHIATQRKRACYTQYPETTQAKGAVPSPLRP